MSNQTQSNIHLIIVRLPLLSYCLAFFLLRHHCGQVWADLLCGWHYDQADWSEWDHLNGVGFQWLDICSASKLWLCHGHFSGKKTFWLVSTERKPMLSPCLSLCMPPRVWRRAKGSRRITSLCILWYENDWVKKKDPIKTQRSLGREILKMYSHRRDCYHSSQSSGGCRFLGNQASLGSFLKKLVALNQKDLAAILILVGLSAMLCYNNLANHEVFFFASPHPNLAQQNFRPESN